MLLAMACIHAGISPLGGASGPRGLCGCGWCMFALGWSRAGLALGASWCGAACMVRCGLQMFYSASAFNQNIAAWNVVSVSNLSSTFDSTTALVDCYKKGMYTGWGATLQAAYPTWSSLWCERLSRTGLHGDATCPWPFPPMKYPRAHAKKESRAYPYVPLPALVCV